MNWPEKPRKRENPDISNRIVSLFGKEEDQKILTPLEIQLDIGKESNGTIQRTLADLYAEGMLKYINYGNKRQNEYYLAALELDEGRIRELIGQKDFTSKMEKLAPTIEIVMKRLNTLYESGENGLEKPLSKSGIQRLLTQKVILTPSEFKDFGVIVINQLFTETKINNSKSRYAVYLFTRVAKTNHYAEYQIMKKNGSEILILEATSESR